METSIVLCDTNIFIEFYKRNHSILSTLQLIGFENIAMSTVTAGELIFGALNKREVQRIKKDIEHLNVLPIDQSVSFKFIELMFKYSKSHGLAVPDGLIAASALVYNVKLYTLNRKDFKFVDGLELYNP